VSSLASLAIVLNDLNNLIVLGKPAAASRSSVSHVKSQKGAIYDRRRHDGYTADTRKAFSSFYSFCFALAKPEYVICFSLLITRHMTTFKELKEHRHGNCMRSLVCCTSSAVPTYNRCHRVHQRGYRSMDISKHTLTCFTDYRKLQRCQQGPVEHGA
jgi:hypothetical protein